MKIEVPENVLPGAEGFYLEGSNTCAMLIHGGGGGSASDVRELGQFISERTSISVYAPLLPGYGTTKEELAETQVDDWLNALKNDFKELQGEFDTIYVIGHSMGGVLALYLANEFANDVAAVVSICAPTKFKGLLIKLVPFFNLFVKYWKLNDREEFKRISNGLWEGYEEIPLNVVKKFKKLVKINNNQLHRIRAPILIIKALRDEFISDKSAEFIFKQVKSTEKSIKVFDSDHAILFSKVKVDLFRVITEFISKNR